MEETKKCKKDVRLPWKKKDFLTITSFLPWKTTIKARNNSFLPWKKIKKGTVVRCRRTIGWVLLSRTELYDCEKGIIALRLTCNKRCSEGSTIARMVWPPLSTIKSVSDTLRVFYLPTRAIENLFQSPNHLPSSLLEGVRVCCS